MLCKFNSNNNNNLAPVQPSAVTTTPSDGTAAFLSAGHQHPRHFGQRSGQKGFPPAHPQQDAGVDDEGILLLGGVDGVLAAADQHLTAMMDMDPDNVRAAFRERRWGRRNNELRQAHGIAEVISKRDFGSDGIFRPDVLRSDGGLFPSGFGYGLLLGGIAFAAVSLPGRMLARGAVGRYVGPRGVLLATRAVALVTAGTVGTRYVQRHQTLEGLKILGTHLSPTEPSPNADALCRHPLITQAMDEQRKKLNHPGRHHDSWGWHQSSSSWWLGDDQILTEFRRVLANCEKRSAILKEKATTAA